MLDPLEKVNLWQEDIVRQDRDRLLSILHAEMERTNDPLLKGDMHELPNARLAKNPHEK